MKNYTIKDRIEIALGNMEFQGKANWDDLEKLEHILVHLIQGKSINDEFTFVKDHFSILKDYINKLEKK